MRRLAVLLGLIVTLAPGASLAIQVNTGPTGSEARIRGTTHAAARVRVPVTSLDELRWRNVVRQRTEIGCAAASLATILTYYFDFPATEEEMVQALYSEALAAPAPDLEEDVLYRGFNLYHVRNVAQKGGLVGAAFHVDVESIQEVRIPVITRVTIRGYDHFVVFREARGGRVYIADPAFGNTVYRLQSFEKIWSGVMMGFLRRGEGAIAEHLLAAERDDERFLTWEQVSRVVDRLGTPGVPEPRSGALVTNISIAPFFRPQIQGLESALPSVIYNYMEFGEKITF
jgi:predicted double-glycine peptidase